MNNDNLGIIGVAVLVVGLGIIGVGMAAGWLVTPAAAQWFIDRHLGQDEYRRAFERVSDALEEMHQVNESLAKDNAELVRYNEQLETKVIELRLKQ